MVTLGKLFKLSCVAWKPGGRDTIFRFRVMLRGKTQWGYGAKAVTSNAGGGINDRCVIGCGKWGFRGRFCEGGSTMRQLRGRVKLH